MVHEGAPTNLKGTKVFIVDQISAGPNLPDVQYFGIEATHSGMCKFESKNSPGYRNVWVTIKSWVEESPPVIAGYWERERRSRKEKLEADAAALLGFHPTPPQPQTQISVPNSPGMSQNHKPARQYRQPEMINGPSVPSNIKLDWEGEVEEIDAEVVENH